MADVTEKPKGKWLMRWRVEDATGAVVRRAKMYAGKGGKRAAAGRGRPHRGAGPRGR